ncbi:MAG: zinc-finger domain-containing protein [Neisseriaceae bacterium]
MSLHENKEKYIEISEKDLPLSCPMPDMLLWNAHPRVFLKIEKEPNHEVTCPYCSTKYKLIF